MGFGNITVRFLEKDGVVAGISRIWCEWFGSVDDAGHDLLKVPRHDFAIVVFGYDYDLGRKGLLSDVKLLLCSNPVLQLESSEKDRENRNWKRSLSDHEDMSESFDNQYDSSGEDSVASGKFLHRLLLQKYGDQVLHSGIISSKVARRELRRHQRIAAEKMCDICQQKMLPWKDVATIMNMNTGKLACSSRNLNEALNVFHTSCLIQWVLLCESESSTSKLVNPKNKAEIYEKEDIFMHQCQKRLVTRWVWLNRSRQHSALSVKMFRLKLKVSNAPRAWMKSPELLQNYSL